jgi:endonuclease-3 related protein
MTAPLRKYFEALLRRYGPQGWWPGETPFEVMVGAVLTQNTSWANVRRAVERLKERRLLDPFRLHAIDTGALARIIRPAGYFRVKARRLKNLVGWFVERWGADLERLRSLPPERLREELLAVHGVGPETADSILLYALGMPSFVVDAYTYRLLTRHGKAPEGASYGEMKELFERELPRNAALYNEFHALIVRVGKEHCRPVARCATCPLRRFLPRRGKRKTPRRVGRGV